jgi:energy-converting hydrogenase Eha subunit G
MFQIVQDPVPKLTQLTIWSSGFLNFIDQCLDKNPETRMSIKQVSMVRPLVIVCQLDTHMTERALSLSLSLSLARLWEAWNDVARIWSFSKMECT